MGRRPATRAGGPGGGRTPRPSWLGDEWTGERAGAARNVREYSKLIEMLRAARERLGDDGITYVKADGIPLSGIKTGSIHVCFCDLMARFLDHLG